MHQVDLRAAKWISDCLMGTNELRASSLVVGFCSLF